MVEIRRRDVYPPEVKARLEAFEKRYGVPTERLEEAFTDVEDEDRFEWYSIRRIYELVRPRTEVME